MSACQSNEIKSEPVVYNDAIEVYKLAESLFTDCKLELSLSSIDSAISLLHELAEQCEDSQMHSLKKEIFRRLCTAYWTRYIHKADAPDLVNALQAHARYLRCERLLQTKSTLRDNDDIDEYQSMLDVGISLIADFHKSMNLENLDTVILLYRQVLDVPELPDVECLSSLNDLATTLVIRFSCTHQVHDIQEGISLYYNLASLLVPRFHNTFPLHCLAGAIFIRSLDTDSPLDAFEVKRLLDNGTSNLSFDSEVDRATKAYIKFKLDGMLTSLDEAIALFRHALQFVPTFAHEYFGLVNNLGLALFDRYEATKQGSNLDEATILLKRAMRLQDSTHPNYIFALENLLDCLRARYKQTNELSDLDAALDSSREAMALHLPSHPKYGIIAGHLLQMMKQRHDKTHDGADLDKCIQLGNYVLQVVSNAAQRPLLLYDVAKCILIRYNLTKDSRDLDSTITYLREARSTSSDTDAFAMDDLAVALSIRFNLSEALPDLDESIGIWREMLRLQSLSAFHIDRPTAVNNLARALTLRAKRTLQDGDCKEAIWICQNTLELEVSNVLRASLLHEMARAILIQYDDIGTNSLADLQEAINLSRRSLELYDESDSNIWNLRQTLADALILRFRHADQKSDLKEAMTLHEGAIYSAISPENRRVSLVNLAQALLSRFDRHDDQDVMVDLDQAIVYLRQALTLRVSPQLLHSQSSSALAAALGRRFTYTRNLADLDECISLCYQGLALLPDSDPRRLSSLVNLATALSNRYHTTGELSDIDDAIHLLREVLVLSSHRSSRPAVLVNLALILGERYDETRKSEDLEESIKLCQEALQSLPSSHIDRVRPLDALASMLRSKFERTKQPSYLEESIQRQKEALDLDPSILNINNMAALITVQYAETKDPADALEAKKLYHRAIEAVPNHYPQLNKLLDNFASHLINMYIDNPVERKHLDDAIAAFRTAAHDELASPLRLFDSAKKWANVADNYNHDSALEAYQSAISLLPRIVTLDLNLEARQQILLSKVGSLASDAARCAIDAGDISKAIEFLEKGRAVFWSQALRLRTPIDELASVAPSLAKQLRTISTALEHGSWRNTLRDQNPLRNVSLEQDGTHLRRLNDKYAQVINDIRQIDGFSDFLQPEPISFESLRLAASDGFIVVLNAAASRCDAVIISPDKVSCLPLLDVDYGHVKACHIMVQEALSPYGRSLNNDIHQILRDYRRKATLVPDEATISPDILLQGVLWLLWKDIVKPVVQFLGLDKSSSPPRLWWCPTGPLAFLPLHAAGDGDDWVFHYVISSYIPSVSTLLNATVAQASARPQEDTFKMVVAIESSSLPFTKEELKRIEERVPEKYLETLGPQLSVDEVLNRISRSSIVHFACHGRQHPREPLQSHLLLPSGRLEVMKIMQKQMPNAILAFLCACETAMGDEDMEDEAIHIAATMLFSGFRSVVGTMWSIEDKDGPKVAEAFYRHLFKSPEPDVTKSAKALHHALSELRTATGWNFKRWVPFLHFGL